MMPVLEIKQKIDFYETSSLIVAQDAPEAEDKLDLDSHNKNGYSNCECKF